jgi:hypothetical protein
VASEVEITKLRILLNDLERKEAIYQAHNTNPAQPAYAKVLEELEIVRYELNMLERENN